MDFFAEQERLRRRSRWLVVWYLSAVASVLASYAAAAWVVFATANVYWTGSSEVPWQVPAGTAALFGVVIVGVSWLRLWQLREGGHVLAQLLGAFYLDPSKTNPSERRLLNVVEEMAIAAGVSVPPVYVLEGERGVNALIAGHTPNEAVLIFTRGAIDKLTRDELQGVVGHEFSHLLNGDMVLNMRLTGLLAGLTWIAELGEKLFFSAVRPSERKAHKDQGGQALAALFVVVVSFIGFPGTLAASAIKAAVSREREFLADAGSVQFTRNPDGIAGALDSLLALPAHTVVGAAAAEGIAHMFFAPAVVHWWCFPTHPPILERIRRAHPRFQRDDYRARRHGRGREVAVIDGGGNVVKVAQFLPSIGRPGAEHLDFAAALLAGLPAPVRAALSSPHDAPRVLFALGGFPQRAGPIHTDIARLAPRHMLTLAELAIPAIRSQPQKDRDAFLAEFAELVEADGRVTLRELVLATFLRQHLREGAGQPIPTLYRSVGNVSEDVRVVLSVIALLSTGPANAAFARGAAVLGLERREPLSREALTGAGIGQALERLRHLAPFQKPAVLKACTEAAAADGAVALAEAEVVRMVAAALDCPVPPLIQSVG